MTHVEPKRIPCALAPNDYLLIGPEGDGEYMLLVSRRGGNSRTVSIALDRPAAKALKKELKAFLKGGV